MGTVQATSNKIFFILAFILFSPYSSTAQTAEVEVLTPFDFALNFRDIHVDDSGIGWAVGTCATLANTQNNGQDWEIGTSPEGLDFNVVVCKPNTNCQTVLLAKAGQVFRSTDGGQNWTEISVNCSTPLGFTFVDEQIIVLAHQDESLFRSTDGGDTWTEIALSHSYRDEPHFPTKTIGYIFQQSGGPLLKSTDAGATWDSIFQFGADALYGDWIDENIGYLYDSNRFLYKTTDGGNNWNLVTDTGIPTNLRKLVVLSETELVAHIFPSNIFRSSDGGVTWENFIVVDEETFGMRFTGIHNNGDTFWIASWGTEILYSTDGLQTATSQFPALRPNFEAMAFGSDQVGYALQERKGLFKTIDGGDTWTQLTNDFFTVSRDFLVLDEDKVIVLYNSSGPQMTEDGGQSWRPLFPADIQDTTFVFRIEQLPSGRLVMFGSSHAAYSDDGGQTWNYVYHGLIIFPRSMAFADDQNGVVGSNSGRIVATTNGGESWELVIDGDFTRSTISNLFATDDGTLIYTTGRTTYCSSDGGQTWSTESCNGLSAPGPIVQGPDGNWYSGQLFPSQQDLLTNIQRSTDEGQTWESIAGFCTYAIPGAVSPNDRYLYVYQTAGFLGRIDLETIASNTKEATRQSISEATVYPNPTNGMLNVELLQNTGVARVTLFDLHGRRVLEQLSNRSSLSLDLSKLPMGVYLLNAQGDEWTRSARVVLRK